MRLLLLLILAPSLCFSQSEHLNTDVLKANKVKSISKIVHTFKADSLIKVDTTNNYITFNKEGKVVEKKYNNGSHIKHLFIYDKNDLLKKEVRLSSSTKESSSVNEVISYLDTSAIFEYTYDESGKIISGIFTDLWGTRKGNMKYEYDSNGNLIYYFKIESNERIRQFETHTYRNNLNEYSVFNYEQMTSDLSYKYDTNTNQLIKTVLRGSNSKTIIHYDAQSGNKTVKEYWECDNLISTRKFEYDPNGLLNNIITEVNFQGTKSNYRTIFKYK